MQLHTTAPSSAVQSWLDCFQPQQLKQAAPACSAAAMPHCGSTGLQPEGSQAAVMMPAEVAAAAALRAAAAMTAAATAAMTAAPPTAAAGVPAAAQQAVSGNEWAAGLSEDAAAGLIQTRHRLLQQALSSPAATPSNVRAAGNSLLYPGRSAAAPHSVSLAATAGTNHLSADFTQGDLTARPASASPGRNGHSSGNGSCKNGMHGSFTGGMVRWGASCSAAGSFTGTAATGSVARSGGSFCGSLGSVASGEVRACPGYQALLRNMPVKQHHSCNGGRPIQLQSGRTSPAGQEGQQQELLQ